jgi:hypothetical protein
LIEAMSIRIGLVCAPPSLPSPGKLPRPPPVVPVRVAKIHAGLNWRVTGDSPEKAWLRSAVPVAMGEFLGDGREPPPSPTRRLRRGGQTGGGGTPVWVGKERRQGRGRHAMHRSGQTQAKMGVNGGNYDHGIRCHRWRATFAQLSQTSSGPGGDRTHNPRIQNPSPDMTDGAT